MAPSLRGRYKLHAYVGTNGVATPDVDGTISFDMVFVKRPEDCRYAVVGKWDVTQHCEQIMVWDLLNTLQRPTGKLIEPRPVITYSDVDQAIMATLMLGKDA